MNIYLINCFQGKKNDQGFYATVKARQDVIKTFDNIGAEKLNIIHRNIKLPKIKGLIWKISEIHEVIKFIKQIKANSIVFFQYPTFLSAYVYIIKILKSKSVKVGLLIHDVESFRWNRDHKKEIDILNMADELIVHTESMKQFLSEHGVSTNMFVMNLFDYYTDDDLKDYKSLVNNKYIIAFAGNLDKSLFLKKIASNFPDELQFYLYGVPPKNNLVYGDSVKYIGKFNPNNVSYINAGWGLVWDGDSIETCTGELGNYLRINASHKLSLYLSAGIPVIVWEKSGVAEYIKNNKLGITISSLKDIKRTIFEMSDSEYFTIIKNVKTISVEIRNGKMLKGILNTICNNRI